MAPIIRRLISSPFFSNLLNHKPSTLLEPLSVRSFTTNLWTSFDSSDELCSINCHGGSMTRTDQFQARRGTHDQITEYPWQLEGPQGTYEAKKVDDGLFVRVDMPGIDKSEVKINVEEDSLVIKGEGLKQSEHESSGRTYVGSIDLCPNFFKLDEAKAQMRNGILRLIIPKRKDGQKESKTVSQIRDSYHFPIAYIHKYAALHFTFSPKLHIHTQTSRLTPRNNHPHYLFPIGSFNTKLFTSLTTPQNPTSTNPQLLCFLSSPSEYGRYGPSFSDFGLTDSGELYGKNYPFQRSGPKGAVERIALKNDKLYMRVDMRGVPKQNMSCFLDHYNNVIFAGLAPKEWEHDDQVREFGGLYGLRCGCCEVAKLHGNITNGVLRMKMSKKMLKNVTRCSYGPHPVDTPIIFLHEDIASQPYQTKGPRESYGAKKVKEGFYVWVDMPGVTKDKVRIGVENGCVLFFGEAGKESIHEESGRTYQGSFGPFDVKKIGKIKTEVKNGVLRMIIPELIGEE